MNIKKFEKFEVELKPMTFDPEYKLMYIDTSGDSSEVEGFDVDEYNPFDLDEIVQRYIKHEGYKKNYWIKKITEEEIDLNSIPEIKYRLDGKKYNL